MSNVRISQLPIETSMAETDVFPSVINGATSQISLKNTAESLGAWSDWVAPTNNTWKIRNYSDGNAVSYTDGGPSVVWFDVSNYILGSNHFRGAIVDFHAYFNSGLNGTMVGTVWISQDYNNNSIQTISYGGDSNVGNVSMKDQPGTGQIGTSLTGFSYTVMVQWTSRLFYGPDFAC